MSSAEARRARFAAEYAQHHNGTRAAVAAGYSAARAHVTASELLGRPDVQAMIRELDAAKREELGVDALWVARELRRVYERCMEPVPKHYRGDPVYVGGELLVEWHPAPAIRALEVLAKVVGLFDAVEEEEVAFVFRPVFAAVDGDSVDEAAG